MRLLSRILLIGALVLGFSSQAGALGIRLVNIGGTYAGDGAAPGGGNADANAGDTLILEIFGVIPAGEAATSIDPGISFSGADWNPAGNNTEAPFNFVNGVLLTPVGAAGGDFNLVEPGRLDGWEATTLDPAGAPGPAEFSIGTVEFVLAGGGAFFDTAASAGLPFGTVCGGAGFENVTEACELGSYRIGEEVVPEPTSASLIGLGLIGLLVAGRRR